MSRILEQNSLSENLKRSEIGAKIIIDNKCIEGEAAETHILTRLCNSLIPRYLPRRIFAAHLISALTNRISSVDKSDLLLLKCLISFRKVAQLENMVQWQIRCFLTRSVAIENFFFPEINKNTKSFRQNFRCLSGFLSCSVAQRLGLESLAISNVLSIKWEQFSRYPKVFPNNPEQGGDLRTLTSALSSEPTISHFL